MRSLLLMCLVPAIVRAQHDTTITIRAISSTLEFVPARISVKTGTRLKLRFVNEGTLPHNFVLPKSDDDIDAMASAAYQAGEHGFVPTESRDKLVAFTRLASPGETVEVEFVVPAAGSYTYICLFPGHAANMIGTLRSLK
jgi:azurin